jgi:hypothetical protein
MTLDVSTAFGAPALLDFSSEPGRDFLIIRHDAVTFCHRAFHALIILPGAGVGIVRKSQTSIGPSAPLFHGTTARLLRLASEPRLTALWKQADNPYSSFSPLPYSF